MAIPDLTQSKLVKSYSRRVEGDEYTTYHRAYRMGRLTLAQEDLEPRDGLPEDATISIVSSRIGLIKGEATNVAIVVARKAKYKTGTISCTLTQALQVVTLVTGGPFYPQMIGQLITITGETNVTVTGYTSPTAVTVDVSQAIAGATAATFPYADTELARSRYYRGNKKTYWSAIKRFHAAPADAEALVDDLWDSYFTFNSYFPRAYTHAITVVDEDPMVLTKSLITVEYRTAYNPKQYPIGKATQEMYTTGDTEKLAYDFTAIPLAIESKPDADGYYYAVETGSNVVPDPRVIFVIRTALSRVSLGYLTLATYAGKGNTAAFSYIGGGIGKHQALCLKVAVAEDYIDDGSDAYVPVQIIFGYYDYDLDLACTSRQRRRWLQAEFVLHPDNNPDLAPAVGRFYLNKDGSKSTVNDSSDATVRIMMHDGWAKNIAGAESKSRLCFLYADFSAIDALMNW